jgi:hypothetical protein
VVAQYDDAALKTLCDVAAAAARQRGHQLGDWESDGLGRRAVCTRCHSVAYVRSQDGLLGMIGRALTEFCETRATPLAG